MSPERAAGAVFQHPDHQGHEEAMPGPACARQDSFVVFVVFVSLVLK